MKESTCNNTFLVESLDHNGRSRATAVADRSATNSGIVGLQHAVQSTNDTGSGRTNGVAQRYSTTVHVHLGQVQVQQSGVDQRHHGEGLVDLVVLHITRGHTRMLHRTRHSIRGGCGELHRVAGRIAEAADLEQRSELVLAGEFAAHDHHGGGSVVQLGSIGRRDSAVLLEGRLQGAHLVHLDRTELLVLRHHRGLGALLASDGDRRHLEIELTGLPSSRSTLITGDGESVLVLTGDAVLGGAGLAAVAHVLVVVDVPEAVVDQAIDDGVVSESVAVAGTRQIVRNVGHRLHTTRNGHITVARGNAQCRKHHSLHATGTHLVDGGGLGAQLQPSVDDGLASRGLAHTSRHNIAHKHLLKVLLVDARSLDSVGNGVSTEARSGQGCQRSAQLANRSTGNADHHHISVTQSGRHHSLLNLSESNSLHSYCVVG
mmetsp:Transcript_13544/g.23753  ORF Transcript_13544/g.23753 Transcript_13544/m.23753 type:complete len:431 (-) Transcript_13544:20-1312(-)